jgi:stearoyl-CoA desaturase (delta-9 desaturase)
MTGTTEAKHAEPGQPEPAGSPRSELLQPPTARQDAPPDTPTWPISRGPVELEGPLDVSWRSSAPFILAHFIPLLALFTGITRTAVVLLVVLYAARVFFLTAGYHRYFAHRTYKMGRITQFVFALGGLTAAQKGPLWWAGWHRQHHRYTDTPRDPHSPEQGFWWSHIGWVLSGRYSKTPFAQINDFARFPELRFLDRHDWVGPWALAIACYLIGGWSGLVVGFFASTVLVWHATFAVNSVTHIVGRRRYATDDTSRNFAPVALLTFGEGWHNNHHRHPTSARQGEPWWEVDLSYLMLRALQAVGLVRDLKQPRAEARQKKRVDAGTPDTRLLDRDAA